MAREGSAGNRGALLASEGVAAEIVVDTAELARPWRVSPRREGLL
jgi:hypothetical protein